MSAFLHRQRQYYAHCNISVIKRYFFRKNIDFCIDFLAFFLDLQYFFVFLQSNIQWQEMSSAVSIASQPIVKPKYIKQETDIYTRMKRWGTPGSRNHLPLRDLKPRCLHLNLQSRRSHSILYWYWAFSSCSLLSNTANIQQLRTSRHESSRWLGMSHFVLVSCKGHLAVTW